MTKLPEPSQARLDAFYREFKPVFEKLMSEPDRGAAIVARSYIDNMLKRAIISRLVDNRKISNQLFGHDKPLGPFAPRARLGLLLGLYDQIMLDDMQEIASLRNLFAHTFETDSFSIEAIKDRCMGLKLINTNVCSRSEWENRTGNHTPYTLMIMDEDKVAAARTEPRSRYLRTAELIIYHLRTFAFDPKPLEAAPGVIRA